MTTDNPESIRCPECQATPDQPCHGLNTMITVGGVTRRAVHAARYAAHLPPGERPAYWRSVAEGYYAEELRNEGATG